MTLLVNNVMAVLHNKLRKTDRSDYIKANGSENVIGVPKRYGVVTSSRGPNEVLKSNVFSLLKEKMGLEAVSGTKKSLFIQDALGHYIIMNDRHIIKKINVK